MENIRSRAKNYTAPDFAKKYRLKIFGLLLLSVNLEKTKTGYCVSVIFERTTEIVKNGILGIELASFLASFLKKINSFSIGHSHDFF